MKTEKYYIKFLKGKFNLLIIVLLQNNLFMLEIKIMKAQKYPLKFKVKK